MPELPEVETTRRGIAPHAENQRILDVVVRETRLRHPVSPSLTDITGHHIKTIRRRSKYLIFEISDSSHLLVHLGMSGSLRLNPPAEPFKRHDHLWLDLENGLQLRYHDPRRFGIVIHLPSHLPPLAHPLLAKLGPEPLEDTFSTQTLQLAFRKRHSPVKAALMDASVVVGVGNIYASESLFLAGIHPQTPASEISRPRLAKLVDSIRFVLSRSIEQGGTTLRDFLHSDGQPGYFRQQLMVYERKNEPCRNCRSPIQHAVISQRSTYWCPKCQKS